MRIFHEESGSVTLIAAFGMIAIMGFLALAIDVGQLRYQRLALQRAADAAALASTLEIKYCLGSPNCAAMQTAAQSAAIENGMTPATLVTNCGSAPTTGLVLTVNNPPCARGVADPNYGKASSVEVFLTQPQPTMFARVLGFTAVPVGARAEASSTGGSDCIVTLDPAGSGALTVQGLASISSPCGIMVESSSSSALSCSLFAAIQASSIRVVGGVSTFLCSIQPTPTTGVSVPTTADPLAYLPLPAVPACGKSTGTPYHGAAAKVTVTGTAVFYADAAYCGGIVISQGAKVTFQPGTYVLTSTKSGVAIKSPAGLSVDPGSTVSGTGVMFYNYGPAGSISFLTPKLVAAGVHLVAPTSGVYAGILFFQPSNNTNTATIVGSPAYSTVLEGTYYFPKATVLFAFNGAVNYNILVAYDVTFEFLSFGSTNVTSGFNNQYGTLANGSPLAGSGAVISQ